MRKKHDIMYLEFKKRSAERQEVIIMKIYVVRWNEKGEMKNRVFVNLEKAEHYGYTKNDVYDITTYVNGFLKKITYYVNETGR